MYNIQCSFGRRALIDQCEQLYLKCKLGPCLHFSFDLSSVSCQEGWIVSEKGCPAVMKYCNQVLQEMLSSDGILENLWRHSVKPDLTSLHNTMWSCFCECMCGILMWWFQIGANIAWNSNMFSLCSRTNTCKKLKEGFWIRLRAGGRKWLTR